MVLVRDVRAKNGALYMAGGQEITAGMLEKLKNWSLQLQETQTMRVAVSAMTASGERVA
jgi:hypothetical protein